MTYGFVSGNFGGIFSGFFCFCLRKESQLNAHLKIALDFSLVFSLTVSHPLFPFFTPFSLICSFIFPRIVHYIFTRFPQLLFTTESHNQAQLPRLCGATEHESHNCEAQPSTEATNLRRNQGPKPRLRCITKLNSHACEAQPRTKATTMKLCMPT